MRFRSFLLFIKDNLLNRETNLCIEKQQTTIANSKQSAIDHRIAKRNFLLSVYIAYNDKNTTIIYQFWPVFLFTIFLACLLDGVMLVYILNGVNRFYFSFSVTLDEKYSKEKTLNFVEDFTSFTRKI